MPIDTNAKPSRNIVSLIASKACQKQFKAFLVQDLQKEIFFRERKREREEEGEEEEERRKEKKRSPPDIPGSIQILYKLKRRSIQAETLER